MYGALYALSVERQLEYCRYETHGRPAWNIQTKAFQVRADAYYTRCKHGFYMVGRIPYGYRLTDTVIDNSKGAGCTIHADVLKEYMLAAIKEKLSEFQKFFCVTDTEEEQKNNLKKMRLTQMEEEIDELLSKVSKAGSVLMKYIDEKVSELDTERKALQEEIVTANVTDTKGNLKQITNHVKTWETNLLFILY